METKVIKMDQTPSPLARFPLGDIELTRRSYAKLIRAYLSGRIDREIYRDIVYGLTGYLGVLKLATDTEFDARLTELEKYAEKQPGYKRFGS